jgi:L-aminopeptidase/D-esterase-like protein
MTMTDVIQLPIAIGHWTGHGTGVTVVLAPPGTVASGEVRGGAPAEREFALLDPRRSVEHVDAVVLAGGSAFGLAAADGVIVELAAMGRGFPTAGGVVPIVPTMCVYDLLESSFRPGAAEGVAALRAAIGGEPLSGGAVGAGAGATVGKWKGREHAAAGGVGIAFGRHDDARWCAIAAVNAVGDVVARDGSVVVGSSAAAAAPGFPTLAPFEEVGNTTLVVLATDAQFTKLQCHQLAGAAHDGFARALCPAHTSVDGDATVVLSVPATTASAAKGHLDRGAWAAAEITAVAIRAAVGPGVVEWKP